MNCAIRFQHVTKTFAHHAGQMLLRDRLKQLFRGSPVTHFYALQDISFELAAGESMGLIGANGAGKSTILNLATRLMRPDTGTVEVNGEVAALLELGAGFHPDLTGEENIRINAALMGLSRRETAAKAEEIIEFSGIRTSIHEPLRTYSSGMTMRLAFSVAIASAPDILLIDEVLGVGDEDFYAKCMLKMREFQRDGKTILFASHNAELIRTFCHQAMWLEHGQIVSVGDVVEVMDAYRGSVVSAS
jgi:ABC-type polysaccharide/polyol phosphate transport system ATPase subunit